MEKRKKLDKIFGKISKKEQKLLDNMFIPESSPEKSTKLLHQFLSLSHLLKT